MNYVDDTKRKFKCMVEIKKVWSDSFLNKEMMQSD